MTSFSQRISPSYVALRALLIAAPLVSSLQVTPNSPCSKVCVDSTTLDLSDPNSSNTRNSDIVCKDADLGSPAGTKWKDCMTCLQTSTFSQGSESDQTWFLYNLRYSLSYCVFGFPNATDVENTPCRTSMACGPLQENLELGILDPTKATAYSYCSGAATHHEKYEQCSQCVSAEKKTLKLANYLTALEAGCQQQPKPGKFVALNDTIFLDGHVTIVDPATITPAAAPSSGLPTNTIIGIVVAGLAAIIIGSAVTFVCYRKRLNRRRRADAEAKYYASGGGGGGGGGGGHGSRHKHNSSLSFQCQTHMQSPRFWPGAEGAPGTALSPVNEMGGEAEREPKMIDPSSQSSIHAVTTGENPSSWESAYHQHPEAQAVQFSSRAPSHHSRSTTPNNNSTSSLPMPMPMPLHQITTSVPPAVPANVYTSPSSGSGGYNHSPSDSISGGPGNISAVSARSTTALLPNNSSNNGSFRPYIPAEHGIHGSPQSFSASTFSSPVSGTTASPLLKHQTWQQQQQNNQVQQKQQARVKNFSTPLGAAVNSGSVSVSGSGSGNGTANNNGSGSSGSSNNGAAANLPPPPPGPPPPKAPRLSLPKKPNKKQQLPPMSGSPIESTEIKTTFSGPPKK